MIRTLSRVLMRQLRGTLIRVNPVRVSAASISFSSVNRRRIKYGVPDGYERKGMSLFDTEDDGTTSRVRKRGRSKREIDEVYSDESDNEEDEEGEEGEDEPLQRNLNINFVNFPRGSAIARKEIDQCLLETSRNGQHLLVKQRMNVVQLMNRGLKPEKIFFTILNDLLGIHADLTGVELYKIHPTDAPTEMQMRKRSPFFAVFRIDNTNKIEPTNLSSIPLTYICDWVRNPLNRGKIITAALTSGCDKMIFTTECRKILNSMVCRTAGKFHDRLQMEFSQSWDTIRSNVSEDANVFVMTTNHYERLTTVPTVDFNELEAWTTDGAVLICTDQLRSEALKFCEERNGREIIIPGAVNEFYHTALSFGAVAVELRKQWDAKSTAKTKKTRKRTKKVAEE